MFVPTFCKALYARQLLLPLAGLLAGLLVGCAAPQPSAKVASAQGQNTWNSAAQAAWQEVQLPGKTADLIRFAFTLARSPDACRPEDCKVPYND